MQYEIMVAEVPTRKVLSKRFEVAADEIGPAIQQTLGALYAHLGTSATAPAGEPMVIYHRMPAETAGWEVEICAPVADRVEAPDGYAFHELEGGTVATTLHVGPYEGLDQAYAAVREFIRSHHFDTVGPPREIYLSEPQVPPSETRTRIEFPVARVPLEVR